MVASESNTSVGTLIKWREPNAPFVTVYRIILEIMYYNVSIVNHFISCSGGFIVVIIFGRLALDMFDD